MRAAAWGSESTYAYAAQDFYFSLFCGTVLKVICAFPTASFFPHQSVVNRASCSFTGRGACLGPCDYLTAPLPFSGFAEGNQECPLLRPVSKAEGVHWLPQQGFPEPVCTSCWEPATALWRVNGFLNKRCWLVDHASRLARGLPWEADV